MPPQGRRVTWQACWPTEELCLVPCQSVTVFTCLPRGAFAPVLQMERQALKARLLTLSHPF